MLQTTRLLRPWRLKTLLIGVAAAGLVLGVGRWSRVRAESFRKLALYHQAASYGAGDDFLPGPLCGLAYREETWFHAERDRIRRRFCREAQDYHKRLATKYRRAAAWPFLPVAPDETPPPLAFPATVYDPRIDARIPRPR